MHHAVELTPPGAGPQRTPQHPEVLHAHAVTDREVLIADYKTNRPVPRTLDEVPPQYVRQLALYRAVLEKLYPGRAVRCALIWTEVPDLMELSAEALDAALMQVKPA